MEVDAIDEGEEGDEGGEAEERDTVSPLTSDPPPDLPLTRQGKGFDLDMPYTRAPADSV